MGDILLAARDVSRSYDVRGRSGSSNISSKKPSVS